MERQTWFPRFSERGPVEASMAAVAFSYSPRFPRFSERGPVEAATGEWLFLFGLPFPRSSERGLGFGHFFTPEAYSPSEAGGCAKRHPRIESKKTQHPEWGASQECWILMSTYLSLHYHLVFSTKHREPWLPPSLRVGVHEYLGGIVKGLGAETHGVGGTGDHVHLLVSLRATHCLADFMRELKKGLFVLD